MRISKLRPLTTQEQDFATKYHKYVFMYLNNRRLSESDFYDIIIFGYLMAVVRYHDRKDLQKYSFSTIAWRAMNCAYSTHMRSLATNKRKADLNALSFDLVIDNTENCTLSDSTPALGEIYSRLEYEEFFQEMTVQLSPIKRKALVMKLDGYYNYEIKRAMKLSV